MSTEHEETGQRVRPRRKGAVVLAGALLSAGVVAVTTAWTSAHAAAPVVVPDSLVKVDLESGKVVAVVPVGRVPGGVEIVGRYVFVASEGDGTLTRVDARTGAVVNSGRYDARGGLAAEGATRVWVASVRRRRVTSVDALRLVDPTEQVPLPGGTRGTSLAVGGGSLWIAASTANGAVVERWRLHPLGRQRTYHLGRYDYGNDVTFGYGAAWVALGAPANALLRIDARSGRARRVPVGRFPLGLAVGFGSVWIAEKEDGTVRRIDAITGRTRRVIAVGHQPNGVAVGRHSILVTNECEGTVSRIDPATNRVVGTIEPGYHPRDVAVRGGFAWLEVAKDVYFDVGTCP